MASPEQLNKEANSLYRKNQYREAALTFLQASELSREMKNNAKWYQYKTWAADSFKLANEYVKAMDFLLDLRLHEPKDRPDYEAWLSQKMLITIKLTTHPLSSRLDKFMRELKAMALKQTAPAADILFLQGEIYDAKGEFLKALQCVEESWQKYNGSGYLKCVYANFAATSCLKLNKLQQATDWLSAILKTDEDYLEVKYKYSEQKLRLFLAEQKPANLLTQKLREFEDIVIQTQNNESQDGFHQLRTRVTLLTHSDTDPLTIAHPAKQSVTVGLLDYKNVHNQYDKRLLLIDFRLASLRYSVGMKAVDDLYYTAPQKINSKKLKFNSTEAIKRKQQALISCKQAEKYAKKIDDLLECDWRQKEVQQRRERIFEIMDHYGLQ